MTEQIKLMTNLLAVLSSLLLPLIVVVVKFIIHTDLSPSHQPLNLRASTTSPSIIFVLAVIAAGVRVTQQ